MRNPKISMTLGELCPDLSNYKPSSQPKADSAKVQEVCWKIRKSGGKTSDYEKSVILRLLETKQDFLVFIHEGEADVKEKATGSVIGKIIAGRLRRGDKVLWFQGEVYKPVTWDNYKEVWDTITAPRPKRPRVKHYEPVSEVTRYEAMFSDGKGERSRVKRSSGGFRLKPAKYDQFFSEVTYI